MTQQPEADPPVPADAASLEAITKLLEEVADDYVTVSSRLGGLERAQQELSADVVREIGALRRDLAGALAYRAVKDLCTALIDPLAAMEAMLAQADFADPDTVGSHLRSLALTLREVLGRMGVEKVGVAVGERYDPNRHRCVAVLDPAESPLPDAPPYTVVRVVQDGYRLERRPLIPPAVEIQAGPLRPDAE